MSKCGETSAPSKVFAPCVLMKNTLAGHVCTKFKLLFSLANTQGSDISQRHTGTATREFLMVFMYIKRYRSFWELLLKTGSPNYHIKCPDNIIQVGGWPSNHNGWGNSPATPRIIKENNVYMTKRTFSEARWHKKGSTGNFSEKSLLAGNHIVNLSCQEIWYHWFGNCFNAIYQASSWISWSVP